MTKELKVTLIDRNGFDLDILDWSLLIRGIVKNMEQDKTIIEKSVNIHESDNHGRKLAGVLTVTRIGR
jgi:hypothetical protein